MFFGDIAQQLIGKPAMLLVATTDAQIQHVPPEIKAVIGQKHEVIVQMSERSLQTDSPTFHVRSIISLPHHTALLLPGKRIFLAPMKNTLQTSKHDKK